MMPRLRLCLLLTLGAVTPLPAWDRVTVAPMKTSIYIGSVTLTPEPFVRKGSSLTASYTAKVWPWFFWSETGRITIPLTDAILAGLARGETAEFTGEAADHRNKPRQVSGRAQPADATSGKFRIRITADGYSLVFNGTYRLGGGP
jgi:hypothetical protein